jgi:hypothetical protein
MERPEADSNGELIRQFRVSALLLAKAKLAFLTE